MRCTEPNLFPSTVKKEDCDSIRLGKWKTRLYFLALLAAVAGGALFNGTRSTVISKTVGSVAAFITATQYAQIKDKKPSCPCSKSNIILGDIVDVDLKIDAFCDVRLPETDELDPNNYLSSHVFAVNKLCDLATVQSENKKRTLARSGLICPELLQETALNDTVQAVVNNAILDSKYQYSSTMGFKGMFDNLQKPLLMTSWQLQNNGEDGFVGFNGLMDTTDTRNGT
jgi:hypothetical protein